MIDAVLFDLDDTLHDDTAVYHRAARRVAADVEREHGIDPEALFGQYLAQADAFWHGLSPVAFEKPLAGLRAAMWGSALRDVGVDDATYARACGDAYDAYRRTEFRLWPGAIELLASLRARGRKLALVTNGMAETHRHKIAALDLDGAFDAIFIADEVGMVKPDVRLFRLAAERLGTRPERCVMVGDRYERDVLGAHDAGMATIWMNVRGESVPAGSPEPTAVVASIGALTTVLERLA